MGLIDWEKKHFKNLDIWDIALIKWGVLFFTLMLVALWPVLASLDWYWYLIAFVVVYIRPITRFFK
ncbi:hypothetical protein ACFL1B_01565 [Nanoarchaeota archaeon]